jgi:multiple sugar transport system permease protein
MASLAETHQTTAVTRRHRRGPKSWTPYLFLVIPLLLFLTWVIGPMLYSFYLSFTNWDGVSAPKFIGLRNYQRLFDDPIFYTALANNVKWLLSFITVPVAMGLGLAVLLNRNMRGVRFIKAAIYSPYILSLIVVGLIWGWMYLPKEGLINMFFIAIGLPQLTSGWLSDPELATWCIIAAAVWRQVGYVMILYLAGLQGVDPTLLEAAKIDGASDWQAFWKVMFPLLQPITVTVLVVSVIDSLRSFDLVFIMTRGGPHNASTTLANFMYIEAFNNYKMGYGAAIAVVLFLVTSIFIFIYLYRTMRNELEY